MESSTVRFICGGNVRNILTHSCTCRTANGLQDKLVFTESNKQPYCRLAFTGWDYSLSDDNNSKILQRNIKRELEVGAYDYVNVDIIVTVSLVRLTH